MNIAIRSVPICARQTHRNAQNKGKTDPQLIGSLTAAGLDEERLVTNANEQLPNWDASLEFVDIMEWERKPDIGSLYHYQLNPQGETAIGQDMFFARRDGEVIVETVDATHGQRITIGRDGSIKGDTGLVPHGRFRSLAQG